MKGDEDPTMCDRCGVVAGSEGTNSYCYRRAEWWLCRRCLAEPHAPFEAEPKGRRP